MNGLTRGDFAAALRRLALLGERVDSGSLVRALADENQQDDPALLYHVGWCLLQNGQASEAAQMFERVRNMPNRNGYARYASWALTNMMISDGNFEEAFATLTVASSPLPRADREVQQ